MADEARPNAKVARVIKSEALESSLADRSGPSPSKHARPQVVNAEEYDAKQTAKQILEDARLRAESIISEAKARAGAIADEAEQQKVVAVAEAREEAKQEALAQAAEELARAKMQAGEIVAGSQQVILDLALSIAQKIIGRDLKREPDVLLEICAGSIESARLARAMVLRVNPKDGALLREKRPKLMELIGRTLELSVRDDDDVEMGGCVIQTEFGTIDGQLKTQFEMLKNVLVTDAPKKDISK